MVLFLNKEPESTIGVKLRMDPTKHSSCNYSRQQVIYKDLCSKPYRLKTKTYTSRKPSR